MSWVRIFRSPEQKDKSLPDQSVRLLLVRGRRICLARISNQIHAIQDECTHSKASLSKGSLNGFGEVVCPLHSYRFDLTSGRCSERGCPDAEIFPVRQEEGETHIQIPE